ncbi:MAG: glycoside hydrolase family 5 protein [Candidatus Weimeria sp.]
MKNNTLKGLKKMLCASLALACAMTLASPMPASAKKKAGGFDMTAQELTVRMGNGTNLANTFEATMSDEEGHAVSGAAVSAYETAWGQPLTTKKMIKSLKKSGFDSIRIPVAWGNAMPGADKGDYTIGKEYLKRVKKVVDWCIDQDMYVILNDHWDNGWWGEFGSADQNIRQKANDRYVSMWKQLSDYFGNEDYHLIFEGGNEEIGSRLNDAVDGKSGVLTEDECYSEANRINQLFVDTVRSSSRKNNQKRFLLIPGYNTDIDKTCDDRYNMPSDKAKSKLLVSVHYYTPWEYAGSDTKRTFGTKDQLKQMNDQLAKMTKFTKNGYGVVIGEYAVLSNSDGTIKKGRDTYISNMLDNCDALNLVPMLWDQSQYFDRHTSKWTSSSAAKIFSSRSYSKMSSKSTAKQQADAKKRLDARLKKAPDDFDEKPDATGDGKSHAWIMWASGDWSINYSVGDKYDPQEIDGVKASDAVIDGEGTYTVSLDFSGRKDGSSFPAFAALGISNGELNYPGYVISIKEIKINGQPYKYSAVPYTTSDDGTCTRVNIYNEWVSQINTDTARFADEPSDASAVSAKLLSKTDESLQRIDKIEITFSYEIMSKK